jgi:hypothetical protein
MFQEVGFAPCAGSLSSSGADEWFSDFDGGQIMGHTFVANSERAFDTAFLVHRKWCGKIVEQASTPYASLLVLQGASHRLAFVNVHLPAQMGHTESEIAAAFEATRSLLSRAGSAKLVLGGDTNTVSQQVADLHVPDSVETVSLEAAIGRASLLGALLDDFHLSLPPIGADPQRCLPA